MGFQLSLAFDGLSWLFACLISGMGILLSYYTASYLEGDPRPFRLYRFLLLLNSAMMGVMLANNIWLPSATEAPTLVNAYLHAPMGLLISGFLLAGLFFLLTGHWACYGRRPSTPVCRSGIPLWKGCVIDEMKA
jgi:NADH:ubiquinone oxidoreductase subunit 5 (subunit L)/multisubunit Na+/H+ antiporter MnhA subunit